VFYRNATNEYLKVEFTNCYLTEPISTLPEPGPINQELSAKADTIEVEIADYIPYYAL
jgi:hypothetical protein